MTNILQVHNLKKRFGAIEATRDLSLEVTKGHIHALIGPNGAGKTTFVNQISGDIVADSGSIYLESRDITTLKPHKRCQLGVARSYQITSIFEELTVEENMTLAILAHNRHNFRFWRTALNAREVKDLLIPSLDYIGLTERAQHQAGHLSHGEKRQLEVGMTLVRKPKLLILDEPTQGLDDVHRTRLLNLLEKIADKNICTMLFVSHRQDEHRSFFIQRIELDSYASQVL